MRCDCGCEMVEVKRKRRRSTWRCPSCELYNAAVAAQQAAARSLAESRGKPGRAWLNEHGIFVQPDAIEPTITLGTPEEARPFAELTTLARAVRYPLAPKGPAPR